MQPDTDFKRVRFAFIEKSSERNLEIFNIETIKVLDTVLHLHPEYETLTGLSSVRTQALLDLTRQLSLLATILPRAEPLGLSRSLVIDQFR
jgi:hypothetical protein